MSASSRVVGPRHAQVLTVRRVDGEVAYEKGSVITASGSIGRALSRTFAANGTEDAALDAFFGVGFFTVTGVVLALRGIAAGARVQ